MEMANSIYLFESRSIGERWLWIMLSDLSDIAIQQPILRRRISSATMPIMW